MADGRGHERIREQIDEIDRRRLDAVALRVALLGVLAPVVPSDAHVWLLTDPVSTVGAAPLAHVPAVAADDLPLLIRERYQSRASRWTGLVSSPSPVALLHVVRPATAPIGSAHWIALLRRWGIGEVATIVFADRHGCWGFLDLWRVEGAAPFDQAEASLLAGVAPAMTRALRHSQAQTFTGASVPRRHGEAPVVLTLDDDLRVVSRTASSQAWLEELLPPAPGSPAVPASVYNVAAQLLAREQGVDDHPATARTHLGDGYWITLRASRLTAGPRSEPGTDQPRPGIVVTIEESSASERLDLFGRAFALTARESQVLAQLAAGADTRAMSRQLGVAESTVQDHLTSIFAKTDVRDRIGVLARALGTAAAPSARDSRAVNAAPPA